MNENYPSEHDAHIAKIEKQFPYELGEWIWIIDEKLKEDEAFIPTGAPQHHWMGCVMHIGSNFIDVRSISNPDRSYLHDRIHFDELLAKTTPVVDPDTIIMNTSIHWQKKSRETLKNIHNITAQLGLMKTAKLADNSGNSENTLMVLSNQVDIPAYKNGLIKARDVTLPELFDQLKHENGAVGSWMAADTMPLLAQAGSLDDTIEQIQSRVFNIELYAGIEEQIEQIREGTPASYIDKLHVMQGRKYMDEECLLNYTKGGMEFRDISAFDRWVASDENLNRLLPFPRCMVAFRVRRNVKHRYSEGLLGAFIKINLEKQDKLTFLYFRNGENVYRLSTELDFDEKIFPDANEFQPGEPMMVKMHWDRIESIITLRDYEQRCIAREERLINHKHWILENPFDQWSKAKNAERVANGKPEIKHTNTEWTWNNPYRGNFDFHPDQWQPFDTTSVYYDEMVKQEKTRLEKFNRIALIIQGLFDRSSMFEPHEKVETWKPESFERNIKLVFDASNVLHHGDAPDPEKYFNICNSKIDDNSIFIGQEKAWVNRETERENNRRRNDYRVRDASEVIDYTPYGDNGPGYIAKPNKIQLRANKAIFSWERESRSMSNYGKMYRSSIVVPFNELFNVSAYKKGDYKQFFNDPRTRADYLKWAPLLLAAEEYLNGNPCYQPQQPV